LYLFVSIGLNTRIDFHITANMYTLRLINEVSSGINSDLARNINEDIKRLNELIEAYNQTTDETDCVNKLKKILEYKQVIGDKYTGKSICSFPDFLTAIHDKLFIEIKEACVHYGITNLYTFLNAPPPRANAFSEILINMDPQQVNALINSLLIFSDNQFQQLYQTGKNKEFDNFLLDNEISFLGGNNSQVFKIAPNNGSPEYVIKIVDRMGMSKLPVARLRETSLKDTLAPVIAERQCIVATQFKKNVKNIVITDCYPRGDLVAYSDTHVTDDESIKSAVQLYDQMLNILIKLSRNECVFPDMKNTNWLVDEHNKLVINDDKSLAFCNQDGTWQLNKSKQYIHSEHMDPPEFINKLERGISISVDKMHAFMFGKNLYQYLTQCGDEELFAITDSTQCDFNSSIFQTAEGNNLQRLIEQLVKKTPEDRISLEEAQNQLNGVFAKLKNENRNILNQINQTRFGNKDTQMDNFYISKSNLINSCTSQQELDNLKSELTTVLKNQHAALIVKDTIQTLQQKKGIGIQNKIKILEQAMCEIPIEDRDKIVNTNDQPGRKVHEAIASHRHFSLFRATEGNNGEIDERKAADSYKQFKSKLNEIKSKLESEPEVSISLKR
jgi:hypothetical protein